MHGNPYDGHTLREVIEETQELTTGREIERVYVDKGYKGREGDRANAVLSAGGYNFRLILNWLRVLLFHILKSWLTVPQRVPR